ELAWRPRGAGFYAELVAFRVPHDGEVVAALDHTGPEALEPGHLVGHGARRAQVEVHTVLRGLGFWHAGEPDARAAPSGGLHERLVGGGLLVHVRPEHGRPERGQHDRVRGVERHRLDDSRHIPGP